ncbi:Caffeoylshikimate esterase [Thalictrum thalictroides]|uniref:Caffeoylshikimate esterase n=1 Tax=Thalictrum thalictroides TaxID=46969 RepID=A0A7J6V2K2_THATH|nr:Caffeoylshikimate esterase [Thalictrum thalictroides]
MVHPIAEANRTSPFGLLTASEFYARHSVSHSSEYIVNTTGLKLFTQCWIPLPPTKIIGTLSVLHGFKDNSSWLSQLTSVHFAKAGYATAAIDYQGHGDSEGLRGHIPDINTVVNDCIPFFDSFRSKYSDSLPSFVYGESLGGAIALLMHLNKPQTIRPWNGLVLHGAMCSISRNSMPPWPLEHLSFIAAKLIPTWKVVPTGPFAELSFKEEWKRELVMASPKKVVGFPRAATGYEFLRVCDELQKRFEEVVAPILIVHGGADSVCDANGVKELYKRAGSKDKTIHVYDDMLHMLVGESDENVEMVFGEIVKWLQERSPSN